MLRESEFWWLVGILEGEGYFGYEKWSQRVQVKMTDLDTIEKVAGIFNKITGRCPAIHESPNKNPNDSLPYVIAIHGAEARQVMEMIVPHMSARRKQRIWQSLNGYKPKKTKGTLIELLNIPGKSEVVTASPIILRRA